MSRGAEVMLAMDGDGRSVIERLAELNRVFLPTMPVSDQELLAGRNDQLFDLLEVVLTPGAHAAIYGERGVGKTSVASVFERIAVNRGNLTARINCIINEDFGRIWLNMADHILDVVAQSGLIEVATARDAMDKLSYSQGPNDVVRYLRVLSAEHPMVLIFDELDTVGDSSVSESFANLMKAISDLSINAHIVVVGVAEDIDALLEGHASVARGLQQIKMPRLSVTELTNIIERGAERLEVSFPEKIVNQIVQLSQGLPHYTHLLAQQCVRQAILGGRYIIIESDWGPAITSAVSKAQQQILDIYHNATASAGKSMYPEVLLACALADKDVQGFFRPADVVEPMSRVTGKNYQIPGFIGNITRLTSPERGPALESRVFADGRPRYRFANPLLLPYVLIRAAEEGREMAIS